MATLTDRWHKQPRFRELMNNEWKRLDFGERQDILQSSGVAGDVDRMSLYDVISRCKETSRAEYVLESIGRPKITLLSSLPKTSHLNWAKADMEWVEMRGDDELFDKSMEEYKSVSKAKPTEKKGHEKSIDLPLPDMEGSIKSNKEPAKEEEPGIDSEIKKALDSYMKDENIDEITSGDFMKDISGDLSLSKPSKSLVDAVSQESE